MILILMLIPTLIALAMFNSKPAMRVALQVFIPVLFFVPMYLGFKVGGFVINATSLVELLLAGAGWMAWSKTIKFNLLDALVVAYCVSTFYSDLHAHAFNVATYAGYWGVTKWLCPYFIGRTLIEQHSLRRPFVRAIILCLAAVAVVSVWEYFRETNLFQAVVERISHVHIEAQGGQKRWGFTRVTGPYGQAITAGLTFATGLFLQIWLVATGVELGSRRLEFLRGGRGRVLVTLAILMGLFMTQSRGPWLGCVFGLIVAASGFAKNRKRAAIIAVTFLICAGMATSSALDKYTSVDLSKATDRDQINAAYRRDMLTTYAPVVAEGGLFGFGQPSFHNGWFGYIEKEPSIDNEYLRVTLEQGYVGGVIFILIMVLAQFHLVRLCATLRAREDILFAYCMLAALVSASFTLTTVALLDPMMQILFLLLGWSQSIQPTRSLETQAVAVQTPQQFAFERVFV